MSVTVIKPAKPAPTIGVGYRTRTVCAAVADSAGNVAYGWALAASPEFIAKREERTNRLREYAKMYYMSHS